LATPLRGRRSAPQDDVMTGDRFLHTAVSSYPSSCHQSSCHPIVQARLGIGRAPPGRVAQRFESAAPPHDSSWSVRPSGRSRVDARCRGAGDVAAREARPPLWPVLPPRCLSSRGSSRLGYRQSLG
jgi:hypothetical protein